MTEMVKLCQNGDRDAFNTLVEKYQNQVVNIAYSMLSDREDAYDAAQEVFVKIYRSIGGFKGKSSLSTWIYRIVSNVCNDALAELNDKYREIITLFDIEQLRYEEIAEILKCPVGTVKSRLNRARAELKKKLLKNKEHFS